MKKPKQNYFDNQEFYNHLFQYRQQLSSESLSSIAKPDEYIGNQIYSLVQHILQHPNFNRYNQCVKEEMVSYALYKCTRGLTLFDMSQENCFGYFTRAVFMAFLTQISKYYKLKNKKDEFIKEYIENYKILNPHAKIKDTLYNMEDDIND